MRDNVELAPGLFYIPGEGNGRFPYANCLLVEGDSKALIDTGAGFNKLAQLPPESVDIVILTHYHPDHIRGIDLFPRAQFWCHPADAPAMLSIDNFRRYSRFDRINPDWAEMARMVGYKSVSRIHREIRDGEVLDFGRVKLTVIHTPGHSPGHLSFWHEDSATAFTVDIDLSSFGPWYGHPSSDIDAFQDSIDKLKALGPKTIVSSHKGIIKDNPLEKLDQYKAVIDKREEEILAFLRTPRTWDQLVDAALIYHRFPEPKQLMRYFEGVLVKKHVDRLFRRGCLRLEGEKLQAV